ncbi:hypothetical protein [Streptomyces sp. NPDC005012]
MSDEPIPTASQAEGERDPEPGEEEHVNPPHTNPSQAEGEADDESDQG